MCPHNEHVDTQAVGVGVCSGRRIGHCGLEESRVPGQQCIDLVDGVIGDAREHVAKVGFGIDAVQLGRLCRAPDYAERVLFYPYPS